MAWFCISLPVCLVYSPALGSKPTLRSEWYRHRRYYDRISGFCLSLNSFNDETQTLWDLLSSREVTFTVFTPLYCCNVHDLDDGHQQKLKTALKVERQTLCLLCCIAGNVSFCRTFFCSCSTSTLTVTTPRGMRKEYLPRMATTMSSFRISMEPRDRK